jgi:hypothetical protein
MNKSTDPLIDAALTGEGSGPKVRNPKKIFMGSAMQETMRKETAHFWDLVRSGEVPGYDFVTMRLSGYGLPKCRNVLTWIARQTDCGRLVCVDSDMEPTIPNLLRLLSHDEEMVSGVYPKKTMMKLEWVGNFSGTARPDGMAPAYDFGGGFCSISLDFMDRMVECYPERAFTSDDEPWKGKIMHDLWSPGVYTDSWAGRTYSRYLEEDFAICHLAKKIGVQPWMDTLCQVGHIGSIDFMKAWMQIKGLENQSVFRGPVD